MTKDERGFIIGQLIPDAQYSGCWYDDSVVWTDERPIPSQEEINQKYIEITTAADTTSNNSLAGADYCAALVAGYEHTDGNIYYCDERATTDMVKALTLFGIDTEEPLPVIDMNGNIHQLFIDDFRTLAAAIGRYQYGLRLVYWSKLM